MNKNIISIIIKASISNVFTYSINPTNTPKWIKAMKEEKIDIFPVKLGTEYSNTNDGINWSNYVCSQFVENQLFELSEVGGEYIVRYDYERVSDLQTKLIYTEWLQDESNLSNPLLESSLYFLKDAIENNL